jgi:predicted HicB family RNase H-like nuclease
MTAKPKAKPNAKRIVMLRLDDELAAPLAFAAQSEDRSIPSYVKWSLRRALENDGYVHSPDNTMRAT